MSFSAPPRPSIAVVAVSVLLLVACKPGVKSSKDGAVLFGATCAPCHAADGKGDPAWKARLDVPDLTDPRLQAKLSDQDIVQVIANGSKNRRMPPWRGVYSDEQIRALTAFVRTLGRR
jgi:mono/diheme cytochrome c family protein